MDKKRLNVSSSMIKHIGFNENEEILFIQYKDGKNYGYRNVPIEIGNEIFERIDNKISVGKTINELIIKKYPYYKITKNIEWE